MHISVRGIIEKDEGIILIHRIKPREDGTLRDYYVVPGGKQEKGESNLETLNREIKEDETMITNYKLSKTVKGVGLVLAVQMLLHTHNYTRFESSRQFAAYCGLVPYPYQSGTSIKGKNKVRNTGLQLLRKSIM